MLKMPILRTDDPSSQHRSAGGVMMMITDLKMDCSLICCSMN